mmetsp:Transcript_11144/g.24590  ORF Transcript_11144/g.24590 Transcript_11144/m.24590 type:complete len:287 (+) Transcript_11144:498-1358(+)
MEALGAPLVSWKCPCGAARELNRRDHDAVLWVRSEGAGGRGRGFGHAWKLSSDQSDAHFRGLQRVRQVDVAPLALLFVGLSGDLGEVLVPEHGVTWLSHFVPVRQVQPNLEEFEEIALLAVEQGKHLRMAHPFGSAHPLHIPETEPSIVSQTVCVVHDPMSCDRDCLEPSMRMAGEAGNTIGSTVVHVPLLAEVRAGAPLDGGVRAEALVAAGVLVVVVDGKEEGALTLERHAQAMRADDGACCGSLRGFAGTESFRESVHFRRRVFSSFLLQVDSTRNLAAIIDY